MTLVNGKPQYGIIQLPKVRPCDSGVYDHAGNLVGQTGLMCPSDPLPPNNGAPATTTPPTAIVPGTLPSVDGIMEWVKANPMIAAGIAAAAFFMFKGK